MESRSIERNLRGRLGDRLRINEPMSKHTTIGVGGCARFLALPVSAKEITFLVNYANETGLEYLVIGKGSNLLVRDGGYKGLVIKIGANFSRIRIYAEKVTAQAGASLSLLARKMIELERKGLEFAVGIPGSVGGAVRMNAGAYGGEIADVITDLTIVDANGVRKTLQITKSDFNYRKSFLAQGDIVISASFLCPAGKINQQMLRRSLKRRKTQPLEYKSFGSTFVNPPGQHAGRLIERCGLKGFRIGGAMISPQHANFIINVGPHTRAEDMETLIAKVRLEVKDKMQVELKPEVVIVGDK